MAHTWKHRQEQRFDKKHPELAKKIKKHPVTGGRGIQMGGMMGPMTAEEMEVMMEDMPKSEKYIRKPKMRPEEHGEKAKKYMKEHEISKSKRLRELEKKLANKSF